MHEMDRRKTIYLGLDFSTQRVSDFSLFWGIRLGEIRVSVLHANNEGTYQSVHLCSLISVFY